MQQFYRDEYIACIYDTWFSGNLDVDGYVYIAKESGSPVLELGCGTGRVLIPIAQAGLNIVGIDNSPEMLAVARKKIAQLDRTIQHRIQLIEADMVNFYLDVQFQLVLIPALSFMLLQTPDEERRTLLNIRHHLAPGGKLIIELLDPAQGLGNQGRRLTKGLEFFHPVTHRKVTVWNASWYDTVQQLIHTTMLFEESEANGAVVSKRYKFLTMRYTYRYEMQHLLNLCGYEVLDHYQDSSGPLALQLWIVAPKSQEC